MTELILIRHGQANSSGENYDELTATGLEQARRVGAWLAQAGYKFEGYFHGGLKRQKQTLDAIQAEFTTSGITTTTPQVHSAFAEFDLKVWSEIAGTLRHGRADFAAMLKDWNQARRGQTDSHTAEPPEAALDKGEVFKKLTGLILAEWVKQGDGFTGAESFPGFQKRVLSALEIPLKKSSRNLAVTSGGPISLLCGKILGLELQATLGLMRKIYNTSIHHLTQSEGRWEIASFNMLPHLKITERTLV